MGRSRDAIKIFLRLRPHRNRDGSVGQYELEHTFDESAVTFHVDRRHLDTEYVNSSREDFSFKFDRVFDQQTTQEEIFESVAKDSVQSVLDGYNSTIFAYGQTGSGKTFSITGGTESYNDRGIIPRAIKMIFDELKNRSETHHTVAHISYMQIYNNKAMDLLNRGKDARSIDELPGVTIHETEDEIVLKGLEAHSATSTHEALNLLFLGDTNRLYSETPMNPTSSRSHCIFSVMLETRAHGSATVTRSKLNLVDLAGSERVGKTGVTGTLLSEAKYINVSLFHLEHVIVALSEGHRHVPFRDSIMTMALKDSLGGNCRTSMLAAGHPGDSHMPETISTCRFAQRVASIRQKAVVNEETDPAVVIRQLKKEIAALKEQVAFLSDGKDTDPTRTLSADEQARCKEAVQRFLGDPDARAELSGLGGDLARINFCFRFLKEVASRAPRPGSSASTTSGATPSSPVPAAAPAASMDAGEKQALLDQIRRLQVSVQQKENELALLFSMMDGSGGGVAAAVAPRTSTSEPSALAGGPRDVPQQQAAPAGSPAAPAAAGGSGASIMSKLRGVAAAQSEGGPPSGGVVPQEEIPRMSANVEDKYDLDKLSDPELLKDRQAAFEAFRKSYRRYESIEKSQVELRERIQAAKSLATTINGLIDQMKALKAHIQQLRAERALMGGGAAEEENADELAAKRKLDEELRPAYRKATDGLATEKERIDHIKHMMHRAQEQVIKDFESWFRTRQAQVAAVMRRQQAGAAPAQQQPQAMTLGQGTVGAPPPPAGPAGAAGAAAPARGESGSSFTAQQHLLQRLDMQRHESRMQTELNPAAGGTPTDLGPSSAASSMVATGNPEADAELARMYKARDELRLKIQHQQQQQPRQH